VSSVPQAGLHVVLAWELPIVLRFIVKSLCLVYISLPLLTAAPPLTAFRTASLLQNLYFLSEILQERHSPNQDIELEFFLIPFLALSFLHQIVIVIIISIVASLVLNWNEGSERC
jgi:hypothetical protein